MKKRIALLASVVALASACANGAAGEDDFQGESRNATYQYLDDLWEDVAYRAPVCQAAKDFLHANNGNDDALHEETVRQFIADMGEAGQEFGEYMWILIERDCF